MAQRFGEFIEKLPSDREDLTFGFIPIAAEKQRWQNNGLLADLLAEYVAIVFLPNVTDSSRMKRQKKIKGIVSYIANELLQNSIQYHDKGLGKINIQLQLCDDNLTLYVTNSIPPNEVENCRSFIQKLLHTDPEELYIQQMTRDIEEDEKRSSGLGLLTMAQDYGAKLGWQFNAVQEQPQKMTITTMVHLAI